MDNEWVFAAIADERRDLADLLDTLSDTQWSTPSLCAEWTVRDAAGHLVVPLITSIPAGVLAVVKAKGNFHRANAALATRTVDRHGTDLPALLRRHAENRFAPPGIGPLASLTDIAVHGQDIRRPLGLKHTFAPDRQRAVLDFIHSRAAARMFSSPGKFRWEATDLEWSAGTGPLVRGPAEAIMLLRTGRLAPLAEVSGEGAEQLRATR